MVQNLNRSGRVVVVVSVLVAAVLLVSTGTVAAQSAPDCSTVTYNGDGTESNPYEVGNVDQLQCVSDGDTRTELNDSFVQVSDIDASETAGWNPKDEFTETRGFPSVGNSEGDQFELARSPVKELLDTGGVDVELVNAEEGIIELQEDTDDRFNVTYRIEEEVDQGFMPISDFDIRTDELENPGDSFTGTFNGNGYTIDGISINRPTEYYVGVFGLSVGVVEETSLKDIDITGYSLTGGLVGRNFGEIEDSYATGKVTGGSAGGLVGQNALDAEIRKSYSKVDVVGDSARGIVGNSALTSDSAGGIVGHNAGEIEDSYATGDIMGGKEVGGLASDNSGEIRDSYAEGNVTGDRQVGGIAGASHDGSDISDSYAEGDVEGNRYVGGLVGWWGFSGGDDVIDESYATGDVTGASRVGGLVGGNVNEIIKESYATGNVTGGTRLGGLVGDNSGEIRESYSEGNAAGDEQVGGLVGRSRNSAVVKESYAEGEVSGENHVGGLVGQNDLGSTVNDSFATGEVSSVGDVGGLVGSSDTDAITDSYWDVPATGQTDSDGGAGLGSITDMRPANEMTGDDAPHNMQGFDFTTTWETVTNPDDYPILAWQAEDDGNGGGGSLDPSNPFADSNGNPVDRQTVIDRVVQWNLNGGINGTSFTRQEIINFIVEWNLAN